MDALDKRMRWKKTGKENIKISAQLDDDVEVDGLRTIPEEVRCIPPSGLISV